MSINDFRFRDSAGLVVLQVLENKSDSYGYSSNKSDWRDAKVEDLLDVADLIRRKSQTDRVCIQMDMP